MSDPVVDKIVKAKYAEPESLIGEQPYVVVMPSRMGGEPTIGHRRITTEQVADMYWHGGFADLTSSYELTEREVVIAVWFEARYGTRMRRARWKAWLDDNDARLWSPTIHGAPANPPTVWEEQ